MGMFLGRTGPVLNLVGTGSGYSDIPGIRAIVVDVSARKNSNDTMITMEK
jgi:hypothetical protein